MKLNFYTTVFISFVLLSIISFFYMTFNSNSYEQLYNNVISSDNNVLNNINRTILEVPKFNSINRTILEVPKINKTDKIYHILQWTSSINVPFVYMGVGQQGFIDRKCPYMNCYVTSNRNYLGNYKNFDVIAFNGPQVVYMSKSSLPTERSPHQKFVFASIESSDYYSVCSNKFDGFFNWTWTFRLDSEVKWGYIFIRDSKGDIVGPKKEMQWIKHEDMDPVNDEFKTKLKSKTKAAAWFVSNCKAKRDRLDVQKKLSVELEKYDLSIDVYGQCSSLKCPRGESESECYDKIDKDYYFYLSFENSFSEDYVTEKLLTALQHNAVPIVFGDANYTRFMPDGMYLNSRELGVEKLAAKMNELIKDPDKYAEYFRWKNHYSYYKTDESVETNEYCRMCAVLNDRELVEKVSIYKNFRKWWDSPSFC